MGHFDRFSHEIAGYTALDIMLADIAIRIQLSPTDYQLAIDHYQAIAEWIDNRDSPLFGLVELFYPEQPLADRHPRLAALQNCICVDEKLSGASGESQLVWFSRRDELLVEIDEGRVPAERGR